MNLIKDKPLVSIITVNYNGIKYLKTLYESLQNITYSPVELIFVDNASNDGSVEFVKRNYPEVKIIQNSRNYMFAKGNNEGIKIAAGEIICLLNNDVKVDSQFIEPIINSFQRNPEIAACQPKVLDLNNSDKFEYAGAAGGFIDKYGFPFMRGRIFFTLERDSGQYDSNLEIFWSSGACFFIRKSVLDYIGMLDEDFIMHMEEIDLCWRMRLQNWKIFCIPSSKVWHYGGGTLSTDNPQKIYWNFRNNIFLLVKNLSFINLIRILCIRLLLDEIAFVRELVRGEWKSAWSIIRAYLWVLKHIRLLVYKRSQNQNNRLSTDKDIFRLVYSGSVVWEYFIRGKRKFSELRRIKLLSDEIITIRK